MVIIGTTVMLAGKAEVIGSVDDPNATRQFQRETPWPRFLEENFVQLQRCPPLLDLFPR
jgi:hypothetical protein